MSGKTQLNPFCTSTDQPSCGTLPYDNGTASFRGAAIGERDRQSTRLHTQAPAVLDECDEIVPDLFPPQSELPLPLPIDAAHRLPDALYGLH